MNEWKSISAPTPFEDRPVKSRLIALLVSVAFAACACVAYAQKDKVLDRFPFEVSVALSVEGQPIQIQRVLECQMRVRIHPGEATSPDYGLRPREIWSPNVRNFYQVLPSGQVFVVFTPDVCDLYSKQLKPLQADYIPTIFWLDARDDFTVFEAYISPRYYETPKARVRFHAISVRNAPDGADVNNDDRYSSLRIVGGDGQSRLFISYTAEIYPEAVWSERPFLAEYLRKLIATTRITDREILREIVLLREITESLYNYAEGRGVRFSPRSRAHLTVPLQQNGNKWKLNENEHGVLRFFLEEANSNRMRSSIRDWSITFEINGKEFKYDGASGRGLVIYDHDRNRVIRISIHWFHL